MKITDWMLMEINYGELCKAYTLGPAICTSPIGVAFRVDCGKDFNRVALSYCFSGPTSVPMITLRLMRTQKGKKPVAFRTFESLRGHVAYDTLVKYLGYPNCCGGCENNQPDVDCQYVKCTLQSCTEFKRFK